MFLSHFLRTFSQNVSTCVYEHICVGLYLLYMLLCIYLNIIYIDVSILYKHIFMYVYMCVCLCVCVCVFYSTTSFDHCRSVSGQHDSCCWITAPNVRRLFEAAYHRRCVQFDNFAEMFLRKDILCRKPNKRRGMHRSTKPFTSGSRGQKPVIVKGSWHMQSFWTLQLNCGL